MNQTKFTEVNSQIASQISMLLMLHECVTVPGFGSLIGNYMPARIHPVTHLIQAPCRQLVFNKSLKTDDGLLTHAVAGLLNLSFSESRELVVSYSESLVNRLKSGEKIQWSGIGIFSEDIEHKLIFKPSYETNFLPEAFGLAPVQVQLIQRKAIVERREPIEFLNREVIPSQRKKSKILRRTLQLAPAIFIGVLFAINAILPSENQMKISDLGFISASPTVIQKGISAKPAETLPFVRQHFDGFVDYQGFSAESAQIFLVAGCYSSESNAKGMVDFLIDKGFDASILDRTPGGLLRVIYGSYANVDAATEELNLIKKGLNDEAWMLVK
jgi:hypothetical protein